MLLTKLLIAPAERLLPPPPSLLRSVKNILRSPALFYDGELLVYADIPAIIGATNCFILGGLHPHLYQTIVPPNCPYPSCHGTPPGTNINTLELVSTIKQVDAVLLSTRSPFSKLVIKYARRYDKPIALVDFPDHEDLYGTIPTPSQIYRGFKYKRDFDLYFKKDLILSAVNEYTLPLEPAPVRPTSYNFPSPPITSPVFYSGRARIDRVQPDRAEVVTLIQQSFPAANIVVHNDRASFMTNEQYWFHLASSHFSLSPSGRIWGSFRHCETALSPHTALIAPQPYIATVDLPLRDEKNSLLYAVAEQHGRYHLQQGAALVEKIRYYLNHPSALDVVSNQWHHDVLTSHTTLARSQYVLTTISNHS